MKKEFTIERHGKSYVLFAGLLDEAHSAGLRSIDTELLQSPTEANGQMAIVKARVEMGEGRTFTGIGDASPDNVGKNIATHAIRMAETRAKARALRDAINVGVTALEELGEDHPEEQSTPPASSQHQRTPGGASVASYRYLLGLLSAEQKAAAVAKHGPLEDWSQGWVSKAIDRFGKKEAPSE